MVVEALSHIGAAEELLNMATHLENVRPEQHKIIMDEMNGHLTIARLYLLCGDASPAA